MQTFEVEIKSLLGSRERADEIRAAMKKADSTCNLISKNKQLNHYFTGGTLEALAKVVAPRLNEAASARLSDWKGPDRHPGPGAPG